MKITCPHCSVEFDYSTVTGSDTLIGKARAAKGLSLNSATKIIGGVSLRELSRIERGMSHPRLVLARKIASAYGSTVDLLWPESPAETVTVETEVETGIEEPDGVTYKETSDYWDDTLPGLEVEGDE